MANRGGPPAAYPRPIDTVRLRREPPPFHHATVADVRRRSPRLVRVTLTGPGLTGLETPGPGASVRLLLPRSGQHDVTIPTWTGNQFLDADGRRPILRTVTPLATDLDQPSVGVEVVLHGQGPLSAWAASARVGARVALSGPGRGYEIDAVAPTFLVAGDESALPAITTVIAALPAAAEVRVLVEIGAPEARVELPAHPRADVAWCDARTGESPGSALVEAVIAAPIPADGRVWAAGEAAAMQRLRRHLFEERGLARRQAVVRGYWKAGRAGDDDAAEG